jgi:hypothetical protein
VRVSVRSVGGGLTRGVKGIGGDISRLREARLGSEGWLFRLARAGVDILWSCR